MPEVIYTEKCPKCEREYPTPKAGDYFKHKEGDKTVHAPNDIDCPCGMTLRWVVPIFKTTPTGDRLDIKPDRLPKRASTEK